MEIFRKRINGIVHGSLVTSLLKYNLQGNDVNMNFYVNASDETLTPRDGYVHFEICDSQSDPRVKALRVDHLRVGRGWKQNESTKYKGCGIGTVLLYEAAVFCQQHFPGVRRFEIDGALDQAHLFYYKLQLHTSKKEDFGRTGVTNFLCPMFLCHH